ncbi:MAG: ATP-binding protein, partial [Planctomycetota bacterium]
AERANARQEAARFVDLAERAGMLEDPPLVDPRTEADLFLGLAQTLTRTGRAEEGEALFARLSRLATEAGDAELLATVEIRRALGLLGVGQRPEAGAAHWHARADRLGATVDGGLARSIAGRLAKLDGDLDDARDALEQADRIFRATDQGWQHSVMLDQLGSVAMRTGRLDDARTLYFEAAEVAERNGVVSNAAVSRTNATLAAMLAGTIEGMDRELRRSIRTFDLSGAFGTAAHTRLYLAEVLFAHGKTGAALEVLDVALAGLGRADHRVALANAWRMRAELLAVEGRLAEAAEAIASALRFAESGGDRTQILVARAVEAMVANAEDRPDDAARAVEEIRAEGQEGAARADGVVLILSEAVLFGMPPAALEAIRHVAHSELDRALLDTSLRLAAGRACDEPLRLLESQTIGLRRASYRLLTDWLAAEAALRSGDGRHAHKRAAAALETAVTLGHTRAEARLRAFPV